NEIKPNIFICGHSHILKVQFDKQFSVLHLNPGAAGKSGFHSVRTMLTFSIEGNQIKDMSVIELGQRR
ncbi:metallophosphoesterase family protein, partial [Arthrospira platensis SPKY1]|nr:metallophosphoesterase family protein [Arthrospira platensis SPKY1]